MIEKHKVIECLQDLPDRFEIDDFFERIIVLAKIERAQEQILNGQVFSQVEMKEMAKQWAN